MDGSHGGSSNSPPPFLIKTYDMVDDPSTNSVVSWSLNNNSFIVWNQTEFSRDFLPKYFKHNNFSSFVRQLNTYGFRKTDPEQWEFANDEFLRDQKHLLKNIHRRKPIHSHSQQHHQAQGNSLGPLSEEEKQSLEEEIERLRQEKSSLVLELQRHLQQQHGTDLQMQTLEEQLLRMEQQQQQMMAFLARILKKPWFRSNLVQQSENHNKKRRLLKPDYLYNEVDPENNRIVTLQTVEREKPDISSVQILNTEPFERTLLKPGYLYNEINREKNRIVTLQTVEREKPDISSVQILNTEPFERTLLKPGYLYNEINREKNRIVTLQTVEREKPDISSVQILNTEPFERTLLKPGHLYNEVNREKNRIVTLQTVEREKPDISSVQILNTEPFERMESSINSWENFFHGVSNASSEEMHTDGVQRQPSAILLNEMHASCGDSAITMQPHSPKLHPFSPISRDIDSSIEMTESTSVESPPISPFQHLEDIRPKVSGIDINSKPAGSEVQSPKEQIASVSAAPTDVNDGFWAQFLTESPGLSDKQEVQSQRGDSDVRMSECKPSDGGDFWWSNKNVDHLTEQMGQLTQAERT
ncbi:heat stress transcription factor A-4b-like [Tasmannia lanceolata]|uniref:heat stress transcription factor A-4b-like n=1 Tax=Tasmannia lanceolata TaxID=3420 RepID=UPI004063CDC0